MYSKSRNNFFVLKALTFLGGLGANLVLNVCKLKEVKSFKRKSILPMCGSIYRRKEGGWTWTGIEREERRIL